METLLVRINQSFLPFKVSKLPTQIDYRKIDRKYIFSESFSFTTNEDNDSNKTYILATSRI